MFNRRSSLSFQTLLTTMNPKGNLFHDDRLDISRNPSQIQ